MFLIINKRSKKEKRFKVCLDETINDEHIMQTVMFEMVTISRHFDLTKTTLTSRVYQLTEQYSLRC